MNLLEFSRRQVLIARILGIPVKADYRWFIVFALMMWLTAINIPKEYNLSLLVALLLGAVTTLAFFVSIFGHELAHAIVARFENIETQEIVLHPFGGLARMKREPDNPRAEFRIAIAGPAASFLIGIIFLVAASIAEISGLRLVAILLGLLFFSNVLLAIFNLFPGYPLDGGRVLRAFLWHRGYELNEATRLTGRCGQIIAIALIIFGLFITLLRGDLFTGIWTILVGIFLLDSASGIVGYTLKTDRLTVGEVMSSPFALKPETFISQLVDTILPLHRQTAFLVAQSNRLYGILSLEDLQKLPRESWHKTQVRQIMRPVNDDFFVDAATKLRDARELMSENGIGALAVLDNNGLLVGFLQKGRIRKRP
ncbi:MAG: site-2 protease family protein [Pyrinomonadaceae bacterium]